MSEMVTVRTRKLWTCLPGKPRWIVGWQQTSAGTRKLFLADQSSHPSNAFQFAPEILGHWHSRDQVFPGPLERNRESRWESCTLLSFWQLQSHYSLISFINQHNTNHDVKAENKKRKYWPNGKNNFISNDQLIATFLLNLRVKAFWRSINTRWCRINSKLWFLLFDLRSRNMFDAVEPEMNTVLMNRPYYYTPISR